MTGAGEPHSKRPEEVLDALIISVSAWTDAVAERGMGLPRHESMKCEELQIAFGVSVEIIQHWLTVQRSAQLASLLEEKWHNVLSAAAAVDELTTDAEAAAGTSHADLSQRPRRQVELPAVWRDRL